MIKTGLLKNLKKIGAFTLVAALALYAAGCGAPEAGAKEGENKGQTAESGTDGVQTVAVGVISSTDEFGYYDEDGELDGYEVALLKEVDRRLEQYEFELQGSDFSNILLSLDTGKIDLGTHMYEYNEERAGKYLYGEEGYIDFSTYFILPADSDYDGSWDSLAGKVVGAISEVDNGALIINSYNEANPEKAISIDVYGSLEQEVVAASLLEGRWDAAYGLAWSVDRWNAEYGKGENVFKQGDVVGSSLSYYLYPKDGAHEELKAAVDGALKEIKADGTLKELSEKYFGIDITPKED